MSYSLPILGWRLWYGDGSIFSNEDGTWAEAPINNVQVLEVLHESPYRTLTYGVDEYHLPNESSVKLGAWMDEKKFYEMVEAVLNA